MMHELGAYIESFEEVTEDHWRHQVLKHGDVTLMYAIYYIARNDHEQMQTLKRWTLKYFLESKSTIHHSVYAFVSTLGFLRV